MIPDQPRIHAPESEQRVFNLLADCPNDWTVLHGVARAEKTRSGRRVPGGECDFIICIPNRGWFVLEVKGYGIRFANGEWFSDYRGRRRRLTETPMQQAQGNAYDMHGLLNERETYLSNVPFYFAVAFPFEYATGPEHDISNTLLPHDCRDPETLRKAIVRIMEEVDARTNRRPKRTNFPTGNLVSAFQTALETATEMVLIENETLFVSLTNEQHDALADALLFDKTIVEGPAGSGKTLLAMQIARRSGARGRRTLVLTNSPGQREWMQLETYGTPHLTVDIDSLWVNHINDEIAGSSPKTDRLTEITEQLRIAVERVQEFAKVVNTVECTGDDETTLTELVSATMTIMNEQDAIQAQILEETIDSLKDSDGNPPWDMLIWDEFQHFPFSESARVIVEQFRHVKIFADFQRQDVFAAALGPQVRESVRSLASSPTIRLTENQRNSGNISRAVEILTGLTMGNSRTQEGPPVEVYYLPWEFRSENIVDIEEIRIRIEDRVNDLPEALGNYDTGGKVVTIIDDHGFMERAFEYESVIADMPIRRLRTTPLIDAEPIQPYACFTDSTSFRGLESPAVIYLDGARNSGEAWEVSKSATFTKYAALTRARTLLCIFTPEANRQYYERHLPDARHIPPDARKQANGPRPNPTNPP